MSIGENGRDYDENWETHQRLLGNEGVHNDRLLLAHAVRDAAAARLDEQRGSLPPDELRARERALWELEDRAVVQSQQLAQARMATSQFRWDTGIDHMNRLEQSVAPKETARERARRAASLAEYVSGTVDLLKDSMDAATERGKDLAQLSVILGPAMLGHPAPIDHAQYPQHFIERPAPARPPELPVDIDQAMAKAYRPWRREDSQRLAEEAQKLLQAWDEAVRNAPSREPPGPDTMASRHAAARLAMELRLAKERDQLEARHEALNTEPEILRGWQDRLREQQDYERHVLAERQEEERLERERPHDHDRGR